MSNDKKNIAVKNNKLSHAEILKARGAPLTSGKLLSLRKRQRRINKLIALGAQISGVLPKGLLKPTGTEPAPGIVIVSRKQIQNAEAAFKNMLDAKYGGM
jgi:hypothetical protein